MPSFPLCKSVYLRAITTTVIMCLSCKRTHEENAHSKTQLITIYCGKEMKQIGATDLIGPKHHRYRE